LRYTTHIDPVIRGDMWLTGLVPVSDRQRPGLMAGGGLAMTFDRATD
jgi:hypothetical protein